MNTATIKNAELILPNDKYDIQDEWLNKIASKYFEEEDVNKLKVGLFGYLNEIMSTSVANDMFHKNFLMDEVFLNTASLERSIYNKAKSSNFEIPLAKPSKMKIGLALNVNDILKYGKVYIDPVTNEKTDNIKFKISNDEVFFSGKYPFMLEHNVIITANRLKNGSYAYSAVYEFIESLGGSTFDSTLTPYISSWVNNETLSLLLDVYQMEKTTVKFENYSSDISESLIRKINFDNQIAKFTVKYNYLNVDTYLKSYFNDTFTPDEKYFHYYNVNDQELTIYFSPLPNNFKPSINSLLTIDIYTTKGTEGNFNYDGDILFSFKEPSYDEVSVVAIKHTNPSNGKDLLTLKEIKQELIYKFLTRDNLITTFDLDYYFNTIVKKEIVNESEITFIKKRDDILMRLFGVYLLMRDKTGLIVPTNTIDIHSDNQDDGYCIPSGSIISYDENTSRYIIDNSGIDKNLSYVLPFSIYMQYQPYTRLVLVKDTIQDIYNFTYSKINSDINAEFIISQMTASRNTFDLSIKNTLNFNFTLNTNLDPDEIKNGNLKIMGILKNSKDQLLGYIKFNLDDEKKLMYSCKLKLNDILDMNDNIEVEDSIYNILDDSLIHKMYIPELATLDILFLYKDNENIHYLPYDISNNPYFLNYSTAVVLSTLEEKPVSLYRSLSSIIKSVLVPKEDGILLRSIPVVGKKYFHNQSVYEDFMIVFDVYYKLLEDAFKALENNTKVDLKFYNTFGKSKYFTSETTNLVLELNVYLLGNYTKNLDFKIKNFIVDLVEKVNSTESKIFALSNLMYYLEKEFDEIEYIEFVNLNGTTKQKIEYTLENIEELSKDELLFYVPEYININIDEDSFTGDPDNFRVGIKINYNQK